jgi:predicted CXXCH cytochrome family protein
MRAIKRKALAFIIGAGISLIVLVGGLPDETPVIRAETVPFDHPPMVAQDGGDTKPIQPTGDNRYCLLCHAKENYSITLTDGNALDLHVTADTLANSVHGTNNPQGALGCVDCHGANKFPHDDPLPATVRQYTLSANQICTTCHEEHITALIDSVHAEGLARGNERAATCVDCHGAHDVKPVKDHPEVAAQVCATCHISIFAEYRESIHGEALLARNDTNAPTCITCHGVHGINQPTLAQARNRSPELCAECHADKELMEKYNITTNVFDSYLNDFHGTTLALFSQRDTDVASNKAVCYDCHGVHNITPADNSKSQVAKQNLLATCQQCHPNATANFPDAWVGHFEPTAENNPLMFGVDLFYRLLIPTVLGGFAVLVASDIFARVRFRITGRPGHHTQSTSETATDTTADTPEDHAEDKGGDNGNHH